MTGELLREEATLTISEICENCEISELKVKAYIEEGIIEAPGRDETDWRFSETTIVLIKKASRLERDLELNPAGVALVLDLMSQIEDLKLQLKRTGSV